MTKKGEQPAIFLVEEDDDTRGVLKEGLIRNGYRVSLAIDEDDAMERAGGGQLRADLVLINLVGKSVEDTLQMGRRIREHAKFDGHTPLVVMAEKYGKDVEGTNVNISGNDWIMYLGEELNQLYDLLASLTHG